MVPLFHLRFNIKKSVQILLILMHAFLLFLFTIVMLNGILGFFEKFGQLFFPVWLTVSNNVILTTWYRLETSLRQWQYHIIDRIMHSTFHIKNFCRLCSTNKNSAISQKINAFLPLQYSPVLIRRFYLPVIFSEFRRIGEPLLYGQSFSHSSKKHI